MKITTEEKTLNKFLGKNLKKLTKLFPKLIPPGDKKDGVYRGLFCLVGYLND